MLVDRTAVRRFSKSTVRRHVWILSVRSLPVSENQSSDGMWVMIAVVVILFLRFLAQEPNEGQNCYDVDQT